MASQAVPVPAYMVSGPTGGPAPPQYYGYPPGPAIVVFPYLAAPVGPVHPPPGFAGLPPPPPPPGFFYPGPVPFYPQQPPPLGPLPLPQAGSVPMTLPVTIPAGREFVQAVVPWPPYPGYR